MQISKLIPTFCAAALCASQPVLHAADTPAQAAARQALAQKLFEMGAQSPETNKPVVAKPTKPVVVAKPEKPVVVVEKPVKPVVIQPVKPVVAEPPVVIAKPAPPVVIEKPVKMKVIKPGSVEVQTAPVRVEADTPTQAAARAALMQKIMELGVQSPAITQPVVAEPVKPVAVKPVVVQPVPPAVVAEPVVTKPAALPVVVLPTQTVKPEAPKPQLQVEAAPALPVAKAKAKPAKQTPAITEGQPQAVPALPVVETQEQKLQALFLKYKADQITPEAYHLQRAAILGTLTNNPSNAVATPVAPVVAISTSTPASTPVATNTAGENSIPGCKAIWSFDEVADNLSKDLSGNGNNATLMEGATLTTEAKVGAKALSLSRPGYAQVSGPVVNTTESFTVAAWVKFADLTPPDGASGHQTILSIDGSSVSGFYLQYNPPAGNKLVFNRLDSDTPGGAPIMAKANEEAVAGTWYHMAGVYDAAAKTLALYINGQLQESVPFTGAWQATGNTAIGRGFYDGNNVDFVNGTIDDARVYAAALSASQIQALATKSPATP